MFDPVGEGKRIPHRAQGHRPRVSAGPGPSQANRKTPSLGGNCLLTHSLTPRQGQDATPFAGIFGRPTARGSQVTIILQRTKLCVGFSLGWRVLLPPSPWQARGDARPQASWALRIAEGRTMIREIEIQFMTARTSWVAYLWHMTRARLPVGGWLGGLWGRADGTKRHKAGI